MIIAIDFDGTIVGNDFPDIKGLKPHAKETIIKLKNDGHYIIIWTCRGEVSLNEARSFLKKEDIPFDSINQPAPFELIGFTPFPKVFADVYVDDKNLGGFPGWLETYNIINSMEIPE
jgi:hypothetical protein